MATKHVVRDGETLDSIAFEHGFFPGTLWDHPENRVLRELRGDMNVLQSDDEVFVPDLAPKKQSLATGKSHTFKRKGVPAKVRLQMTQDHAPRASVPFVLVVDGVEHRGQTDDKGMIEAWVSPDAEGGWLRVGDDAPIPIAIGYLDPLSSLRGVQQRLRNLGFDCEEETELGDSTCGALVRFQQSVQLPPSGELDDDTRKKLGDIHDRGASAPPSPFAQES